MLERITNLVSRNDLFVMAGWAIVGLLTFLWIGTGTKKKTKRRPPVLPHNPGASLFDKDLIADIAVRALATFVWKPSHRSRNQYNKLADQLEFDVHGERYFIERGLPRTVEGVVFYQEYSDLPFIGSPNTVYFVGQANDTYYWADYGDASYWLTMDKDGKPRPATGKKLAVFRPAEPNNSSVFFNRDVEGYD